MTVTTSSLARLPRPLGRIRESIPERFAPYAYVAPFFLLFAVFGLFPLAFTFVISLFEWNPIGTKTFVGFDNFSTLLTDPRFWNAAGNTLSIWVMSTVPQLIIALGLAHLLHAARLRFANFFRMSLLIPYITSVAATAIVFAQLFDTHYGLVNWVLTLIGGDPVNWLAGRLSSQFVIALMVIWRWVGYTTLLYLSGLQSIPREMYEAASVDGAGGWRQFTSITVPSLRPIIIFTVITSTIGGLQIFTEPLLVNPTPALTCGAARQCQTLTLYLYEQAFGDYKFGYGAAIGVALFVMVVAIAAINFALSTRLKGSH
ncbi:sugar ABC transporter permease [Gryllotalpicola koreensis]|uniref:Sugar ABC transporter permease n=1 Tax=Gryllotalpicola koreensis TaxID=993086 RepID=A0ABP8ACL1_9MICO